MTIIHSSAVYLELAIYLAKNCSSSWVNSRKQFFSWKPTNHFSFLADTTRWRISPPARWWWLATNWTCVCRETENREIYVLSLLLCLATILSWSMDWNVELAKKWSWAWATDDTHTRTDSWMNSRTGSRSMTLKNCKVAEQQQHLREVVNN